LIGYGYGKDQTVVNGQIQQISDRIIYSGDNQPGKSGGAIIQEGRWVGLNVAQSSRGQEAIKPEQVNQFLQSATQIPAVQGRKSLI
jgi:hypothetical protein